MTDSSAPRLKMPDAQLEQARMMLDKARWAAARMQKLDRAATLRIAEAVAKAVGEQVGRAHLRFELGVEHPAAIVCEVFRFDQEA